MFEFLKQLQETAFVLSPFVLAGAGFALVWLGLCLWLGGLRWLKFLAGLVGAGTGYATAMALAGPQQMILTIAAVAAGLICMVLSRTAVVIIGATLAALIAAMVLAKPVLGEARTWSDMPRPQAEAPGLTESISTLETCGQYAVQKVRQTLKREGSVVYTASCIAGLAVLGIGFALPRGVCALTCAILGTTAIALGLLLLLCYKGAKPMDYVLGRQTMFWIIALMMIGFGMLVNLALCPSRLKKASPEKKQAGDKK